MSVQQIALFIAAGVSIWVYMDAKKITTARKCL
jgi:hypothetical protein